MKTQIENKKTRRKWYRVVQPLWNQATHFDGCTKNLNVENSCCNCKKTRNQKLISTFNLSANLALHLNLILPLKSNTNSTFESIVAQLSWKCLFNHMPFFFENFNGLNWHRWIHNHAFILPNINYRNIIRCIIIKNTNISGKNFITKKVFIFELTLKGLYFDMLMNKRMTNNKITKK